MRCEDWLWLRSFTPTCGPGRIRDLGGATPEYDGRPSGEADTLANRVGGIDLAFRRLEIDDARDVARHRQPNPLWAV